MGMSLVGRPVVSQEEHLARALGGETGCSGQRGSQGRRAPRGRAERSQGAPRYTRSSHLGPRPDPPGSCRTLGSHQAEASQVACTGRGPGAGRGVCAGASLRAHTVPQASRVPAALHCPLGEHGPAGLLAAASLSRCGCSHLGPRDSAGRQCEVAMAQGIVSRNVHSHSIRLLESGSRHVSVGGVAPVGMSLLLFLSLSEQRAALQGVRVCKCVSLCLCVCSAVCPGVYESAQMCTRAQVYAGMRVPRCVRCAQLCAQVYVSVPRGVQVCTWTPFTPQQPP